MQVKKQQLGANMEKQTHSKLEKEYIKAMYCHPAYLTYIQSTSCVMPAGWSRCWDQDCYEKYQQPQIRRWYCSYGKSEEEFMSLLMKVKEESEKSGLKLNIQKTKIMASGPITSWQIDGEIVETVTDFIFLGSKTSADGDCSHEIKMLAP